MQLMKALIKYELFEESQDTTILMKTLAEELLNALFNISEELQLEPKLLKVED